MPSFEIPTGHIDLPENPDAYDKDFECGVWGEVVDPSSPESPRGLVMQVPAGKISRVWQLVEVGYREQIELLSGSGTLVVYEGPSRGWARVPLTPENPSPPGAGIRYSNLFCVVAGEEDAWVLSRPSRTYRSSFEQDVSSGPGDAVSQFIMSVVMPKTLGETVRIIELKGGPTYSNK
jgi:hypothetical protein